MRLTSYYYIVSHTLTCLSMTVSSELLGHIDLDTQEWTDGVLTFSTCKVVKEPPKVTSWTTCDGDVDPGWIESLNSVLGREKGHSGWYWVVIEFTHCMSVRGREETVCICVNWLHTCLIMI